MSDVDVQFLKSAEELANYIAASEEEDFKQYPSANHVYYHAMVILEGFGAAQNMLMHEIIRAAREHKEGDANE